MRVLLATVFFCLVLVAPAQAVTYTVQGDSLSVITRKELPRQLKGWQQLSYSAGVGRHYWEAWPLLRQQPLAQITFFPLGTNDYQSNLAVFLATLRQVLEWTGPGRCVVMATLYDRRPIRSWNLALRRLARRVGPQRLQLAGWASAVQARKARLADGVHPRSARDVRVRARLLAQAARRCLPESLPVGENGGSEAP